MEFFFKQQHGCIHMVLIVCIGVVSLSSIMASVSLDSQDMRRRVSDAYEHSPPILRRNQPPTLQIFYQWWGNSRETQQFSLLTKQLLAMNQELTYATSPVSLHVDVITEDGDTNGEQNDKILNEFCDGQSNLKCEYGKRLSRHEQHETLATLYEFCRDNPGSNVAFIHDNIEQEAVHKLSENLLLHLTRAVTSQNCHAGLSGDTCNACGLLFTGLFTFEFPGNVFAADCSYVNQLLAPIEFEKAMNEHVAFSLLAKARGKLVMNLMQGLHKPHALGIDKYASNRWVASHPGIKPCQVAENNQTSLQYWDAMAFDNLPALGEATLPVFSRELFFLDEDTKETYKWVLEKPIRRRREFTFMGGLISRWYSLYGIPPTEDSWLWKWFPDEDFWKSEIKEHGKSGFIDGQLTFAEEDLTSFLHQNNATYAPVPEGRTVVVYTGPTDVDRDQGKNWLYMKNFEYFLDFGVNCSQHDTILVLTKSAMDHYSVRINHAKQQCKALSSNKHALRILEREDRCYDMESMRLVLQDVDLSGYDYFVYLNCGVVGPRLPKNYPYSSWTHQYTSLLSEKIKMSGLSINCDHHPHVQSMLFAVDRVGLQIIMDSDAVHDCGRSNDAMTKAHKQALIQKYEVGMGRAIFEAGFGMRSTHSMYGAMEIYPSDLELENGRPWCDDMWYSKRLPYHQYAWEDLVFFKSSRGFLLSDINDHMKYGHQEEFDVIPAVQR